VATTRTRKVRGSRTQALVAEVYQRIWPHATSAGGGAAGRDVLNVPLSIEVKGRRVFSPLEWIRQARKAARPEEDEFPPHVVMRPDGVGEASTGDFLVIRRLADDIDLMAELLDLRKLVAEQKAYPLCFRTRTGKVLTEADIEVLAAKAEGDDIELPDEQELRRRRRELLEYTDRNGSMSMAARAELEELRAASD
jgi:hypothetical protein